ncbi:MAG: hypothetical protein ABI809_05360 [Caldimonas sp.]
MKVSLKRHAAALAAALVCAGPLAVQAQSERPPAKGTPKAQPTPSATSTIPAGIDGGTPSTSNSLPLGTPTRAANDAERADMRRAAAAARAAARPKGPSGTAATVAASASAASAASKAAVGPSGSAAPRALSPVPSPTPSLPAR